MRDYLQIQNILYRVFLNVIHKLVNQLNHNIAFKLPHLCTVNNNC